MLENLPDPILEKIYIDTVLNKPRTAAFRYCGPDPEGDAISYSAIMSLPDYRPKHFYFDYGN